MTYGEAYGPAMKIETQEEADTYFEFLVQDGLKNGPPDRTRAEAEEIVKGNLGYYAGYHDNTVRERVERLFKCAHPVFGPISAGSPTPEEALEMGKRMGAKAVSENNTSENSNR